MKKNDKFDPKTFAEPDAVYSPIYAWVWNAPCTKETVDEQLAEMQRMGVRALYIIPEPKNFRPERMPTFLEPDYLTPAFFEMVSYAIHAAADKGMYCWFYDEGGWPSGGACGKVLADHPEYARRILTVRETAFAEGEMYSRSTPDVMAAFVNECEEIREGYCFTENTTVTEYSIYRENVGSCDYPDLLNKEATEYFISITHDGYAAALQDIFGSKVTAVFTDEPKAPCNPFSDELAEKYEKAYGESILPHLPLIAGRCAVTDENIHVLYRWYDLCSRTFCENFLLPCRKWAKEHGIAFTGHMDLDNEAIGCMRGGQNFHLMRALRCLDIPGIDVIWRQIYPDEKISRHDGLNGVNGFFPRYASSAAAQNGTDLAMTEVFGVYGPGLTYEMMRYIVGYHTIRGVTIINPLNISLGRSGHYLGQELPAFTDDQLYYKDLGLFNRYSERLSYLAALGERVYETALYFPVHDFWGGRNAVKANETFENLGRELEYRLVDFDIVDDDVIGCALGADEGVLYIGNAAYRHIVIPENVYLPAETTAVLD